MRGKGAMVWKLRDWKGGDPEAQLDHALELGLSHVCIKINDGRSERWEGTRSDQNADLLPDAVATLTRGGVAVTGWGWTYGCYNPWGVVLPSASMARAEAKLAMDLCHLYGMSEYYIDAETQYNRSSMVPSAIAFAEATSEYGPDVRQGLCSYRFPKRYQPQFPVEQFAPHMEFWSPQVYFLLDNREQGADLRSWDLASIRPAAHDRIPESARSGLRGRQRLGSAPGQRGAAGGDRRIRLAGR